MENTTLRKMTVYAMGIVSLLGVAFVRRYYLLPNSYYWYMFVAAIFAWFELICAVTTLVLVSTFKRENINKRICFAMSIAILSIVGLNFLFDMIVEIEYGYNTLFPYIFMAGIEVFLFIMFMRVYKGSKSDVEQEVSRANVDDLLKYKSLLDQGVITQEEYDKIKSDILK